MDCCPCEADEKSRFALKKKTEKKVDQLTKKEEKNHRLYIYVSRIRL